jgi:hypothetical protein
MTLKYLISTLFCVLVLLFLISPFLIDAYEDLKKHRKRKCKIRINSKNYEFVETIHLEVGSSRSYIKYYDRKRHVDREMTLDPLKDKIFIDIDN